MIIKNGIVEPSGKIELNNKTLGRVSQYEYLGMIIEHNLNVDRQIESM